MKYLALCAIVKNEAPYIQEWMEFHKLIGVENFVIYDNGSTDGLQDILSPYIDRKEVEYVRWPVSPPCQLSAYRDCLIRHREDYWWIGFIDIDEFIFPPYDVDLKDFLKAYEHAAGLAIHWRIFGSSGHEKKPEGLVLENYLKRAPIDWDWNQHVKSIVNPRWTDRALDPHIFSIKFNSIVDEYGVKIKTPRMPLDAKDGSIRIHHYFCKSKEEYEQKRLRGRADIRKTLRSWNDFTEADRNEEVDERALHYVPKLRKTFYAA